jgi:hypothetical protein
LGFTLAPVLTPGSPSPLPTLALVARAQGGLTLGPEGGELGAEKYSLGEIKRLAPELRGKQSSFVQPFDCHVLALGVARLATSEWRKRTLFVIA